MARPMRMRWMQSTIIDEITQVSASTSLWQSLDYHNHDDHHYHHHHLFRCVTTSLMEPSRMNKRRSRRWSPTWRCTPTSLSRFQYFYKCFKRQCCLKRRYEVFNHAFPSVITQGKMELVANLFHIQNLNFRSLKWSLHCFWGPGAIEQVILYKDVDWKVTCQSTLLIDKCIWSVRQFEGTFEKSLWRKFYRY